MAARQQIWTFEIWRWAVTSSNLYDGTTYRFVIQEICLETYLSSRFFDRENGEAIWPIEERIVPASTVPGERASKTQPFPTKPAAFDLQGLREEDLIDFTDDLRNEAIAIVNQFDFGIQYHNDIL